MTFIEAKRLTTYDISKDGSRVLINFSDENCRVGSLALSTGCLGELIMSLPNIMQEALRRQFRDSSLRLVYPLGNWRLEMSTQPGNLILTLTTKDGFFVSFAVTSGELRELSDTAEEARYTKVAPPN